VGQVVTGPTPDGEVVTGPVAAIFYTDGEGLPLSRGPVALVDAAGCERAVRLADLDRYRTETTT
jgi:hypothetical protein